MFILVSEVFANFTYKHCHLVLRVGGWAYAVLETDKHNYHSRLEPTIWQYDHQINQCQKQLDITMSVTNKEFVLQLRNHFSALADWGDQDGDTQQQ